MGRQVEGSGGKRGEKQETMREALHPAGALLLLPLLARLPSPLPKWQQG